MNSAPPVITHSPVSSAGSGTSLVISAGVTDDTGVSKVLLFSRPGQSELPYLVTEMTADAVGGYSATIPAYYITPLDLRYYIKAVDIDGNEAETLPVVTSATGNAKPDTAISWFESPLALH